MEKRKDRGGKGCNTQRSRHKGNNWNAEKTGDTTVFVESLYLLMPEIDMMGVGGQTCFLLLVLFFYLETEVPPNVS